MRDQYLINMRFAWELLQFLHSNAYTTLFDKPTWELKLEIFDFGNKIEVSTFHNVVGWSILDIITEKLEEIRNCFDDFMDDMQNIAASNENSEAYFTRCALNISAIFFKKGYSHEAFLAYCAMVFGVAYHFLLLEPNPIPHLACNVIALVLFSHQMTGEFYEKGGWRVFRDMSLYYSNSSLK